MSTCGCSKKFFMIDYCPLSLMRNTRGRSGAKMNYQTLIEEIAGLISSGQYDLEQVVSDITTTIKPVKTADGSVSDLRWLATHIPQGKVVTIGDVSSAINELQGNEAMSAAGLWKRIDAKGTLPPAKRALFISGHKWIGSGARCPNKVIDPTTKERLDKMLSRNNVAFTMTSPKQADVEPGVVINRKNILEVQDIIAIYNGASTNGGRS